MSLLEPFSMTSYTDGQHYGVHHDSVFVNRTHTLLFYLNTLETNKGGQTIFPDVPASPSSLLSPLLSRQRPLRVICDDHNILAVNPTLGSVLLWENIEEGSNVCLERKDGNKRREDGVEDAREERRRIEQSRHASCPVKNGTFRCVHR